jgi:uncharacterized protein (DUF433 family)
MGLSAVFGGSDPRGMIEFVEFGDAAMTQLDKIYPLIAELNPVEREELLAALSEGGAPLHSVPPSRPYWVVFSEHPSIVATPGVCGGAPRLIRTRIPVWSLERMRQLGVSEADILKSYPTLRAADLVQAWSYAERHRGDIDKAIQENEED